MLHYSYFDSPLGRILLAGDGAGLRLMHMQQGHTIPQPEPDWQPDHPLLHETIRQLEAYFAGTLRPISGKPAATRAISSLRLSMPSGAFVFGSGLLST